MLEAQVFIFFKNSSAIPSCRKKKETVRKPYAGLEQLKGEVLKTMPNASPNKSLSTYL